MSFISWIVLGAIAGAIAKNLIPGKHPTGFWVTIAIGVLGALLGGMVSSILFGVDVGAFFDIRSWVIAVVGSLALLAVYQKLKPTLDDHNDTAQKTDTPRPGDHHKQL